jgi:hypothetical protein
VARGGWGVGSVDADIFIDIGGRSMVDGWKQGLMVPKEVRRDEVEF